MAEPGHPNPPGAMAGVALWLLGLSWSSNTTSLPWPSDLNHCTFQHLQDQQYFFFCKGVISLPIYTI